jgi:hypothetical protein
MSSDDDAAKLVSADAVAPVELVDSLVAPIVLLLLDGLLATPILLVS